MSCNRLSASLGLHICATAASIDRIDLNIGLIQYQKQTLLIGHIALVTTGVKVVDGSVQKVPFGLDFHFSLVVATEYAVKLVDRLDCALCGFSESLVSTYTHCFKRIGINLVEICCGGSIVQTDIHACRYSGVVSAAVYITVCSASKFNVRFFHLGLGKYCKGGTQCTHCKAVGAGFGRIITVVSVAASEYLTYKNVIAVGFRTGVNQRVVLSDGNTAFNCRNSVGAGMGEYT